MRGYITRRYNFTLAVIGYYDMETNKMVELSTVRGNWKNTEQVLKYVKKHKSEIGIPDGKQPTVLQMDKASQLRKCHTKIFMPTVYRLKKRQKPKKKPKPANKRKERKNEL